MRGSAAILEYMAVILLQEVFTAVLMFSTLNNLESGVCRVW